MALKQRLIFSIAWLGTAFGLQAEAAVLRVPSDFTTIRSAAASAVADDTILVAPGKYYDLGDPFSIRSGVSVLSEQGRDETQLLFEHGGLYFIDDTPEAAVSVLAGFSVYGGEYRFDHPTVVEGNHMHSVYPGYSWSWVTASCEFRSNVFSGIADGYFLMATLDSKQHCTWIFENNLILTESPFVEIGGWGTQELIFRNNTCVGFHGIGLGTISQSTEIEVVNNILYGSDDNHPAILSCPNHPNVTYDLRYNAFWRAVISCPLGPGSLDADPIFCDPEDGDYRLHATSPLIGAGEGGVTIGAFGVGCGVLAVEEGPVAGTPALLTIAPNPVGVERRVTIGGLTSGGVIEIINPNGRLVDVISVGTSGPIGWYPSRDLAAGVYFARMRGHAAQVARFVLIR